MRHPSLLLQGLAAPFRTMMAKAHLVPAAMDLTYRVAIKTVIFGVGVVLLFGASKAVFGDHVMIEPISVPRKLEEDGYSGVVVSRLLLEEFQAIKQSGDRLQIREPTQDPLKERVSFRSEEDFATLATIQVPSSSLSLRSITVMLRDFIGAPERKIGGAITIRRPDGPDKPALYTVALLFGASADLPATPEEDANLLEAIRRSARSIARQYDPVGLAAHYLRNDELKELQQLADALIGAGNSQRRKEGLFIRGLHETRLYERKEKKTFDAIAFFQEAIEEDPKFSEAYNAWGTALVQQGPDKDDEAIEKYSEAIRLNPFNGSAHRNRAVIYKRKEDHRRAIADYEKALALGLKDFEVYFDLGRSYHAVDEHRLSVLANSGAIRLKPNHSYALNNRCYDKAILGDRSAIEDCDKSLRLLERPATYDSRGFAHLKFDQLDKAIDDYDAALKFDSEIVRPWALFGRGVAKRRKGDIAGGDADIKEAERLRGDIRSRMEKLGVKL